MTVSQLNLSTKLHYVCFAIVFFVLLAHAATAQTNNNATGSDFRGGGLSFSTELGGFYYQDITGLQVAIAQIPFEGSIDKTYTLDTNDLISIDIKGNERLILKNLLINSSGEVIIPSFGSVKLKQLTIKQAEDTLKKIVESELLNPSVSISLEIPRPIYVHITGSIPFPGKFILPAQSRLDLAIMQAVMELEKPEGEITIYDPKYTSKLLTQTTYSYRNIEIVHKDSSSTKADLVNYFRTGNLAANPILKDGDQISLKRRNRETPTISISGAVSYGYELEYRKGDTPSTLLEISSGFEDNADTSKLYVFRKENEEIDKILIPPSKWKEFQLQPNDRVIVPFNYEFTSPSTAWVNGEVKAPGNYPIKSGTTSVLEILELSGGLTEYALINSAYLVRGGNLKNEIQNKFNIDLMKRTSDQVVQGLDYLTLETNLSRNKVFLDLTNKNELSELKMFDGDQLYIPRDEQTIFIFGQVNNPGYFPISKMKTLSVFDYIKRAGGYSLSADKDRVFIIKSGSAAWFKPEDSFLESGDRIFVDKLPTEELNALRTFEIQKQQIKNQRTQLIMTAITTITGIITTYVAVRNIN